MDTRGHVDLVRCDPGAEVWSAPWSDRNIFVLALVVEHLMVNLRLRIRS